MSQTKAELLEPKADFTISGTTPTLTIGDAGAEDTKIVFDGNAQDFYIGLDDSADDLIIGLGSTVGTTPIISVDENKDVAIPDGGLTITTSDNTTQITLTSTDADASSGPALDYYRNSSSPADSDYIGTTRYIGRNDNSQDVNFVSINVQANDVSDGTEDGTYIINTMRNGASDQTFNINPTEVIINEDSKDVDFRVEGNNNAYQFFVDAANGCVMIEQNGSPGTRALPNNEAPMLQVKGNSDSSSSILASRHQNSGNGPAMYFYKSRHTDPGAFTIVAKDDDVGTLIYCADDGTDALSQVAMIKVSVDQTPGANDTPGRITFRTTPDGSNSTTERLRIAHNGDLTATDTSIASNSDQRLKENIADYNYDINKFKQFKAKTFDWKNKKEHNGKTSNRGFIAQEIAAIDDYWTDQIALDSDSEDAKLIDADSDGNHMAYTLKLGKKDAMYISVIQQLITRIEALEG